MSPRYKIDRRGDKIVSLDRIVPRDILSTAVKGWGYSKGRICPHICPQFCPLLQGVQWDKGTNAGTSNSNPGTNSAILAIELLQRQTFCSPNDLYSLQGSSCRLSQIDPQILRSSSCARVANRSLAYSTCTTGTVYCCHTGILWREDRMVSKIAESILQSSIHCHKQQRR